METSNVLIIGGSGLIGQRLRQVLAELGYHVRVLSRGEEEDFRWDPENSELDEAALEWAEAVVFLAGAGVNDKRWSNKRKQVLRDSRVKTTELLYNKLKEGQLKTLVAASAIGYYGDPRGEVLDESAPPGADFLGQLGAQWEAASNQFSSKGVRVVLLRTGIVLSREGGALPALSFPITLGAAPTPGFGQQHLPWIHIDDLCGMYVKALQDSAMSGAYNAVAPELATNRRVMKEICKVRGRLAIPLPTPRFLLKLALGGIADILFYDVTLSSEKISQAGYEFKYPTLRQALQALY